MSFRHFLPFILLASCLQTSVSTGQLLPERQWQGYRGYMASGVLDNANLPETFDFEKSENIKWKIEIPGLGLSSPVIWGNRLFITTAIGDGDNAGFKPGIYGDVAPVNDASLHEWKVYCIDKTTGKIIWERTSYKGVPKIKRHPKSTHANTTVATDGQYVVAFFGSEGLYCYDIDGNLLWKKRLRSIEISLFHMQKAEWEFASSPIIHKGAALFNAMCLKTLLLLLMMSKQGKSSGNQSGMNTRVGARPIFIQMQAGPMLR